VFWAQCRARGRSGPRIGWRGDCRADRSAGRAQALRHLPALPVW